MAQMEKPEVDEFAFLGEEFLAWLWFCSERRGGLFAVTETERIGVALDRLLEFKDEETGVRVVVRGDAPTRAPEAREALSRGMRLLRAGLVLTVDGQNVNVTLDAATLDLRSLKAEKPDGETVEERNAAALAQLLGSVDAVDRVYRAFLVERTSPAFLKKTSAEVIEWMRRATEGAPRGSRAMRAAAAGE